MLTLAQFDQLSVPITDLYTEFHTSVIIDIARRLKNLDFTSAAWQIQRLQQSGLLYDDILKRVSKLTGIRNSVLKETFAKAGIRTMRFDDAIYRAAGLEPIPLKLSPAMMRVLEIGIVKTQGILNNLTLTTAITGQDIFIQASDLAYMQITSGAMSYMQAIKQAVISVSRGGLPVITYPTGKQDKIDVAVRRTVLTGVGQTTAQLQIARMDEMGTVLVQTSAHIGARNKGDGYENHELWQGKIFSRNPMNTQYPDFVSSTGYGTITGLAGVNCRHSFYPFFGEISENAYKEAEISAYAKKTVTYNGEDISVYEATQAQRRIERKIRQVKREISALKAAEIQYDSEQIRLKRYQAQMRDFIMQTGLQRQRFREQVFE